MNDYGSLTPEERRRLHESYPAGEAYWRLELHNRVRVDYGLGAWIIPGRPGDAVTEMTLEIVALRARVAALRAGRSLHLWPAFGAVIQAGAA